MSGTKATAALTCRRNRVVAFSQCGLAGAPARTGHALAGSLRAGLDTNAAFAEARAVGTLDFFVSYTKADKPWADWIVWQLNKGGYSTRYQGHFKPGKNFVQEMNQALADADRLLLVLSPNAIKSRFVTDEWSTNYARDSGKLLPVRVVAYEVRELPPLLQPLVPIDLVEKDAEGARAALLEGVTEGTVRPLVEPSFPGPATPAEETAKGPHFPGRAPTGPGRRNLTLLVSVVLAILVVGVIGATVIRREPSPNDVPPIATDSLRTGTIALTPAPALPVDHAPPAEPVPSPVKAAPSTIVVKCDLRPSVGSVRIGPQTVALGTFCPAANEQQHGDKLARDFPSLLDAKKAELVGVPDPFYEVTVENDTPVVKFHLRPATRARVDLRLEGSECSKVTDVLISIPGKTKPAQHALDSNERRACRLRLDLPQTAFQKRLEVSFRPANYVTQTVFFGHAPLPVRVEQFAFER